MRNGIRIRKENETDVKPEITLIMEIVNIEARTFEAMLSAFRTFADRLDTLCRLYGDMEEKKWLDNQEVCLLLKVSPRTLQTLRDNGTLAYTQICHKTYYKPGDVESIVQIDSPPAVKVDGPLTLVCDFLRTGVFPVVYYQCHNCPSFIG